MNPEGKKFTPYLKLLIALLAITQFTVILDFMVMSPLGDMLMKSMDITTAQFGMAVSAYAFSAGISGLLTAGFADRYDRKKLLLFFYSGFTIGTLCCGLTGSYHILVLARIITGVFGGVIGSITMAIMTDQIALELRGRAMGFIQMGFGASQVLGIPIALYLANIWGWQSPFLLVVALAVIIMILIMLKMRPVTSHLGLQRDRSALEHLWHTFTNKRYIIGFSSTALLSIGGFMMMPFGSAYAINNLKVTQHQLPILFMMAGIGSLIFMPLLGKLSDRIDKFRLFTIAAIYMMFMVVIYTNLPTVPFPMIVCLNILMMAGILGRMVPSTVLVTAIPEMKDRGAFMSVNSSMQQIAGGVAAAFAGLIVVQKTRYSPLEHYNTLGWIIVGINILSIFLMYRVSQVVKNKTTQKIKENVKETVIENTVGN